MNITEIQATQIRQAADWLAAAGSAIAFLRRRSVRRGIILAGAVLIAAANYIPEPEPHTPQHRKP